MRIPSIERHPRAARFLAIGSVCAAAIFYLATPAKAVSFDANGKVNGWNITPFSQANGNTTAGGITSIRQNNYSPLDFPNGIGHVPSPGGTTGEKFDLEELHIRQNGTQVQVLLIASSLFQANNGGPNLNLGDLLISTDADDAFELGVVTQSGNAGLNAGRLYTVNSTLGLQNLAGSYIGTSIATEIGAWAVNTGVAHDLFNIETASYNFGGTEGTTYAYQYTFDLGFMQTMPSHLDFQMSWGCGNDMIEGGFNVTIPPPATPSSVIPEPAPMALFVVFGWLALAMFGRSRRVRA
jgi:hypothetical protein